MELIKQVEINIDYILTLIKKYHASHLQDKEIIVTIQKAIDSSMELRNKKDLIEAFIDSMTPATQVDDDFKAFVKFSKNKELDAIIAEENLNSAATYKFIENAFRDGYIQVAGTALAKILPPASRFSPDGGRAKKREAVIEKLSKFFDRFRDIVS